MGLLLGDKVSDWEVLYTKVQSRRKSDCLVCGHENAGTSDPAG
jgi:hypothetical protein